MAALERGAAMGRAGTAWRLAEMIGLYVVLPLVLTAAVPTRMMAALLFPALWVGCVGCLVALRLDPTFDRRCLWNARGFFEGVRGVVAVFVIAAPVVGLGVWLSMPEMFLSFPRERPKIWAIVMVGYPLASVYAQEIVWRAFFFHRYEPVFARLLWRGEEGERAAAARGATALTVIASGSAFGFMHILFKHWVAVALTVVGGLLFSWTYAHRRSIALVWVEHALWGCFVFTIGLGQFFFLRGVAIRGEALGP
ncbi:MAG: CPBP family intramembrane metalloprotease [Phycisphaeraceae bacterium]|nr:CPBP family intramembrane metalloprotease [Phycisphaeraceae bacterium]